MGENISVNNLTDRLPLKYTNTSQSLIQKKWTTQSKNGQKT